MLMVTVKAHEMYLVFTVATSIFFMFLQTYSLQQFAFTGFNGKKMKMMVLDLIPGPAFITYQIRCLIQVYGTEQNNSAQRPVACFDNGFITIMMIKSSQLFFFLQFVSHGCGYYAHKQPSTCGLLNILYRCSTILSSQIIQHNFFWSFEASLPIQLSRCHNTFQFLPSNALSK